MEYNKSIPLNKEGYQEVETEIVEEKSKELKIDCE